jgi:hypothetical protein
LQQQTEISPGWLKLAILLKNQKYLTKYLSVSVVFNKSVIVNLLAFDNYPLKAIVPRKRE